MQRLSDIRKKVAPQIKTTQLGVDDIPLDNFDKWDRDTIRDALRNGPIEVPVVPNIDSAILTAVVELGGRLEMDDWHGQDRAGNEKPCGTTHCRAGWAIALAGKAGRDLEKCFESPGIAGGLIYAASRPGQELPNFFCSTDKAMADLQECAAREQAREVSP